MARAKEGKRLGGPGYSVRAFSIVSELPYRRVEKAIQKGEIRVVELGDVKRIPDGELERVLSLFGKLESAAE